MATNAGDEGDGSDPSDREEWTQADEEAARDVERRCGIALVPDGLDE